MMGGNGMGGMGGPMMGSMQQGQAGGMCQGQMGGKGQNVSNLSAMPGGNFSGLAADGAPFRCSGRTNAAAGSTPR